jgi:hypothetical protein
MFNDSDPSGTKPCNGKNSKGDVCDLVANQDWKEVLRWAILDPKRVPFGRLIWMKAYLTFLP